MVDHLGPAGDHGKKEGNTSQKMLYLFFSVLPITGGPGEALLESLDLVSMEGPS